MEVKESNKNTRKKSSNDDETTMFQNVHGAPSLYPTASSSPAAAAAYLHATPVYVSASRAAVLGMQYMHNNVSNNVVNSNAAVVAAAAAASNPNTHHHTMWTTSSGGQNDPYQRLQDAPAAHTSHPLVGAFPFQGPAPFNAVAAARDTSYGTPLSRQNTMGPYGPFVGTELGPWSQPYDTGISDLHHGVQGSAANLTRRPSMGK